MHATRVFPGHILPLVDSKQIDTYVCMYIEFSESFRLWGKCGDGHVFPTLPKIQNHFFYTEVYLGRQPFKRQLQPQIQGVVFGKSVTVICIILQDYHGCQSRTLRTGTH
jgi:hypothetical protein